MAVCGRLADFPARFLLHTSRHGGCLESHFRPYENSPCCQSGLSASAWPCGRGESKDSAQEVQSKYLHGCLCFKTYQADTF